MKTLPNYNLISLREYFHQFQIEDSLITSLLESGEIEITTIHNQGYIDSESIEQIEKILRLYFDLNINPEGIASILHLLDRMNLMHCELTELRNKIRNYESD